MKVQKCYRFSQSTIKKISLLRENCFVNDDNDNLVYFFDSDTDVIVCAIDNLFENIIKKKPK